MPAQFDFAEFWDIAVNRIPIAALHLVGHTGVQQITKGLAPQIMVRKSYKTSLPSIGIAIATPALNRDVAGVWTSTMEQLRGSS